MGKYLQRMTHEGKEMLFVDFANTREEASLAAWDELKQELLKERGAVLVLIDARNTPRQKHSPQRAFLRHTRRRPGVAGE